MAAWTATSQRLIGSNSQEYVPQKASINGHLDHFVLIAVCSVEFFVGNVPKRDDDKLRAPIWWIVQLLHLKPLFHFTIQKRDNTGM